MTDPTLSWWVGQLVAGHGVASGRASDSPYPAGTITLQAPHFRRLGLDLAPYQPATLNLEFGPGAWQLRNPDHCMPLLRWTDRHPPETFSFWRCRLRWLAPPHHEAPAETDPRDREALIYHPHPETKRAHHHSASRLEVLAPPLGTLPLGTRFALGVDAGRCRFVARVLDGRQALIRRHQLLEFLKFRVLAAQHQFFVDLERDGSPAVALRDWLAQCWPAGCALSDADLLFTLEQARQLYTEEPRHGGP
ncbi:MAG: hypothetical protein RLZZ516_82 [Cyanobacteriota bacterium]|jgi:hypothetical protein